MSQPSPEPPKDPATMDEVSRLEAMHQRMLDQQEAWRKLLENLADLKRKVNPDPPNETPST
jgi:hypothetical protein